MSDATRRHDAPAVVVEGSSDEYDTDIEEAREFTHAEGEARSRPGG